MQWSLSVSDNLFGGQGNNKDVVGVCISNHHFSALSSNTMSRQFW